ncbi:MAG: glycosyltransferase family 4 protein [Bacteroidales bacterium]|nr:glycosyltransferase family 4 protein [Bacteroidales bacterium]
MNKVLIITYYWPPSGGAGVQRWLKFTKYLRNYGWEPVIYTPQNPEAPAIDESLLEEVPEEIEVVKRKIWEPYQLYKRFIGQSKEEKVNAGFLSEKEKPGLAEKLSVWIRGNLFIPDARKYWIKPSVKFLTQYLKKNPVDVIISTGPPHSMHMIALGIREKLNIPWLADFRDPWTQIDFYDQLNLSRFADKKHHRLERKVLQAADKVVTVSNNWAEDFSKLGNRPVDVITNGFDEADFEDIRSGELPAKFELIHIGAINKDRNSENLWKALSELREESIDFNQYLKIKLIGKNDFSVIQSIDQQGLSDKTERISYLPHRKALKEAAKASVLLLPLNNTPNVKGIIPGKIFEYLALQKPVLCIGPPAGDSARILQETGAGETRNFEDKEGIKGFISHSFSRFKEGKSLLRDSTYQQYSRRNLTKALSRYLDEFINQS